MTHNIPWHRSSQAHDICAIVWTSDLKTASPLKLNQSVDSEIFTTESGNSAPLHPPDISRKTLTTMSKTPFV